MSKKNARPRPAQDHSGPSPKPQAEQVYTVKLSASVFRAIMQGLGELQAKVAYPAIQALNAQILEQQPKAPTPPK